MTSPSSRIIRVQQERWHILFLLVWAFVLHYPFIYTNGAGDSDSFVLVNGIIHAINKQDFLQNPLLVFNFYSFGYYWLIFKLQPIFAPKLTSIFPLINNLGFICSVLTTLPLYLLLKNLSGAKIAFYSLLIYHLTPTIFEVSTYGHPATAAWLLITIAVYLFQRCLLQDEQQSTSNYLLGATIILTTLAMCLRADVLLVVPMMLGLLYYHNCLNKKWLGRLGICLSISVLFFSILQVAAHGISWTTFSLRIFLLDINKFHVMGNTLSRLARGLGILALTLGPLACLLASISFFYLYRKQRRVFIALSSWVLPIVIFWLPFPAPSRHFLYAIPGLVVGVVYLLQGIGKKYLPLVIILFLMLNYYSPLLLYQSIVNQRPQPGLPKGQKQVSFTAPLLPAIENHFYLQKEINTYWRQAQAVAKIKDKSVVLMDNFALSTLNTLIASRINYSWNGRSYPGGGNFTYNLVSAPKNEYLLIGASSETSLQQALKKFEQNPDFAPYYVLIFPQTLNKYPDFEVPKGYKPLVISESELGS